MIVKLFKSNKQPIQKAFAYFLNGRVENNTARLLWGNRDFAELLTNHQSSSVKYFSGCLSFKEEPRHFSEQDKYGIMNEFMCAIMSHEDIRARVNWTWIEHTDKGRLELNFVVNTRFLEPIGHIKQYNFFCKNHFQTIDAFQDFIDAKYHCASWKTTKPNLHRHHLNAKQSKTFNHEILQYMVENIIMDHSELKTRSDLVTHLKLVGFNVSREVRGSISVLPEHSSKPIRLSIAHDVSLDDYRQKLMAFMHNEAERLFDLNQIDDLKEKLEICKQRTYAFEQKRYFKQHENAVQSCKPVLPSSQKRKQASCQWYIKTENCQKQSEKFSNSLKNQEKHIKICFSSSYHPMVNQDTLIDELNEEEYTKYMTGVQKWLIEEAAKSFGWTAYLHSWWQSVDSGTVEYAHHFDRVEEKQQRSDRKAQKSFM